MGQVQMNQGQVTMGQQGQGIASQTGQPAFNQVVSQQPQQFTMAQPGPGQGQAQKFPVAQQGVGQPQMRYLPVSQTQPQNINPTQQFSGVQPGQACTTLGGQFNMGHPPMAQSGQPAVVQSQQPFLTQPLQPISSDQSILQPKTQAPSNPPAAVSPAPTPPVASHAQPVATVQQYPTAQSPAHTPGSPQNLPARVGSGVISQQCGSVTTAPAPSGPALSRQLSSSTTSSLDDILSSSPDALRDTTPQDTVLTPKILTAQELQQQKEEAMKLHDLQQQPKDPFTVKETLDKFVTEVERFEKVVENLCKPRLSGPSHLVTEWKVSQSL